MIAIEIGHLLGKLSEKFTRYDKDVSVVQAIDGEIKVIQDAVIQNGFEINFYALEYYRSRYKPELGQSFYERHRFLVPDVRDYVEAHEMDHAAAEQFLHDPFSLREHRLSRYFSFQN